LTSQVKPIGKILTTRYVFTLAAAAAVIAAAVYTDVSYPAMASPAIP
jgi:hypothetical protein